eukprot:6187991-Pleurochrysis_carterae.AAC.5
MRVRFVGTHGSLSVRCPPLHAQPDAAHPHELAGAEVAKARAGGARVAWTRARVCCRAQHGGQRAPCGGRASLHRGDWGQRDAAAARHARKRDHGRRRAEARRGRRQELHAQGAARRALSQSRDTLAAHALCVVGVWVGVGRWDWVGARARVGAMTCASVARTREPPSEYAHA